MFFDEPRVDEVYQELLTSIAKKQQELFLHRFNWNKREPKLWPPKGLFGKDKKAIARYDAMVQELEQLKAQTVAHRKKQGYPSGTFWWNMPWDQVENYLMCDLTEWKENGAWRFQRDWEVEKKGATQILFLRENGHCSNFSSNSTTYYEKESIYSEAQQSAMVNDYRKRQKDMDFNRILFSDNRPVYSYKSKQLYASEADYILSAEHYLYQENARERFERSLYTEHITQEVTVVSNSRHYECCFAVGGFHLCPDGTLDLVQSFDYEVCGSRGHMTDDVVQEYAEKDATIALAAYLADSREVAAVPMQLFGRNITDGAPSYSEAMRQAELYTCLAHKLHSTD